MWRPTTESEILEAIDGFTETDILEAKEKIPKGVDVAKQVAAMATSGGTIVYGIAEDHGLFSTSPFPLAGAELQITQAATTTSGTDRPTGSGRSRPMAIRRSATSS